MIQLDEHDAALFALVKSVLGSAVEQAHSPVAVSKKIAALAMRYRNRGRTAARNRYPFQGICEASGLPLEKIHAVLDELDPQLGYSGPLRWVCHRANNSGRHSCGKCE